MKATVATLAFVGAVSAQAGAGAVFDSIVSAVEAFDTQLKGYNGGDTSSLLAASNKINSAVSNGAKTISSGPALSQTEALGLVSKTQGLKGTLTTTFDDLQSKADPIGKAGGCKDVNDQISQQAAGAKALQDAVKAKSPTALASAADALGGEITTAIKDAGTKFSGACKSTGGSSAPSSGSSAPSSGASAPSSGSSSSGASSGAAAPAPSSDDTATATYGDKSQPEPAASSTAPNPATYTGAASSIKVGSGLTLAAVAAFWAL